MKKILALLLLLTAVTALAQKKYENKAFKFSIQFPENWIENNSNGIPADKILSEKEINEMFLKDKSIYLTYFQKFNIFSSINPKVQFNIVHKKEKSYADFKKKCIESTKELKQFLDNFEFIDKPEEIVLSNIKSIYFSMKYTMEIEGRVVKVRNKTYAIPLSQNYLLRVSMVDLEERNDCSQEFDNLIQTFKTL